MKFTDTKSKENLSLDNFLEYFVDSQKVHAKSLISTFFGDLAIPYGGKAWVEIISFLLEPLGVSNRLVRTSLFRLVEEGWVESTRMGRNSYYQLTDKALEQTKDAEKLIYHPQANGWNGRWALVFILKKPDKIELRTQFERELKWMGFGAISKHIYAHPNASIEKVAALVKALKLNRNVACMYAENISETGLDISDTELAAMCYPTNHFDHFVKNFSKLDLATIRSASVHSQLLLRLLLIDEYRRIIIRDPHLAKELLPDDWIGYEAYSLCKSIYTEIFEGTNAAYLKLLDEAGEGLISGFIPHYAQRFK